MKKRRFLTVMMTGMMAVSMLSGCGSGSSSASSAGTETAESTGSAEESNVLRVGMECAYAPFNWTQDTDTTPDGRTACPIYGSDYYAYGYDVAVAQMLAEEMGMERASHKVKWSSIGIFMGARDYYWIIAGSGRTSERAMCAAVSKTHLYKDKWIGGK